MPSAWYAPAETAVAGTADGDPPISMTHHLLLYPELSKWMYIITKTATCA